MIKIPALYYIIPTSGCLLSQIIIEQRRINIQQYMLASTVFHHSSTETYKWVRGGRNSDPLIMDFNWETSIHDITFYKGYCQQLC